MEIEVSDVVEPHLYVVLGRTDVGNQSLMECGSADFIGRRVLFT